MSKQTEHEEEESSQAGSAPKTTKGAEQAAKTNKPPKPHEVPQRTRLGPRGGREDVEERALTAALELLARRPYRDVSVRDIAERAHVSHALLHRYLGSKEDILAAVLERREASMAAAAAGLETLQEAVPLMLHRVMTIGRDYVALVTRSAMDELPYEQARTEFPATQLLVALAERQAAGGGGEDQEWPEPRVLAAAIVALALGWVAIEGWLLRAAQLTDMKASAIEDSLTRIMVNMIDANLPPVLPANRTGAESQDSSTGTGSAQRRKP